MIRQVNLIDCNEDLNTTNRGYLSASTYPKQKDSCIGKWTYIRYKNENTNESSFFFYTANGQKCHKRDGSFYYDNTGIKVPEDATVIMTVDQSDSVNNRYRLYQSDYPNLTVKNSGIPTLFEILRYDDPENNSRFFEHKVILRSEANEVLVLRSEDFEKIYDLEGSKMLELAQHETSSKGGYYSPNITSDTDQFISSYNNEHIYTYHIQDDNLLGLEVYTEFEGYIYWTDSFGKDVYFRQGKYYYLEDNSEVPSMINKVNKNTLTMHKFGDLFTQDNSFNTMDLTEYATEDGDLLVEKNGSYYYHDKYYGENDPRNEQYLGNIVIVPANQFKLTDRIRNRILHDNSNLMGYSDEILTSYPYFHNNHEYLDNNIDIPRRAHNKGTIIRADLNGYNSYIVVKETDDNGNVRYVCQDEARFYYNTNKIIRNKL